jgi:hypothetical protein
MTAAAHPARLSARALVRVAGRDWRSLLQGLVTQDVETLAPGALRYAALLTPQGRLLHELFLLGTQDGALLDVAASQRDALVSRLSMYRLRAKAEIAAAEGAVFAGWGDHLPAGEGEGDIVWTPDPRLAELGWRGYGAAGDAPAGDSACPIRCAIVQTTRPIPSRRTSTCCTGSTSGRAASSARRPPRG